MSLVVTNNGIIWNGILLGPGVLSYLRNATGQDRLTGSQFTVILTLIRSMLLLNWLGSRGVLTSYCNCCGIARDVMN